MSDSEFMQMSFFDVEPEPEAEELPSLARVPDAEYKRCETLYKDIKSVDYIIRMIGRAAYKTSIHEFLADIFELGALAVSNQLNTFNRELFDKREKAYLSIINKYDKDTRFLIRDIFNEIWKLISSQHFFGVGYNDYLGEIYMRSETSSKHAGQFFTPYNLSKMCAKTAIDAEKVEKCIEADKILTFHEPTCGSGGMIIAAADVLYNDYQFNISRNMFVECGDIDRRCVHMAYLQLSAAGIPAVIYHRDGLSLETWDRWETPALLMQWLRFRQLAEQSYSTVRIRK